MYLNMSIETLSLQSVETSTMLPLSLNDGSTATVHDLRERFFQSKYGLAMADQELRFTARYGYDRERMLQDLGNDVSPVGHQYDLPRYLDIIMLRERGDGSLFGAISDQELATLSLACAIHDIGESEHPNLLEHGITPVGDIPAGNKTNADRAAEKDVREFFYQEFYADVPPETIERIEAIISHHDETLLHDLYEAAHELQSLDTAIRAKIRLFEATHGRGEALTLEQELGLSGITSVVRPRQHRSLEMTSFIQAKDERDADLQRTSRPAHIVTAQNAYLHELCETPLQTILPLADD